MSQEVFEMITRLDREKIETHLVIQCAPMISGMKISNLLIVERRLAKEVRRVLNRSGIAYFLLLEKEEKVTFLIYHEDELKAYLAEKKVCQSMRQFGYENLELAMVLERFKENYESYTLQNAGFPHEMGLLLGYPVEDVEGFIQNEGKNYLYAGYWKVYADAEQKMALFAQYEEARKELLGYLTQGYTVRQMLQVMEQKRSLRQKIGA